MPATGHRRGNLVYHWKHGYIPLDHFAALQKAHHSKSGAVKEMQKRGIPVPKGYSSDHKPSVPKPSPAPTHSAGMDPHAIRATQLREAAAKKRAEADRIAGNVGAPDRAGAMLRAKDSARMNARMDSGLRRFTEKQREASALESQARSAEGRSKAAAEKQRAADLGVTASKLSPGDVIVHKGSIHFVQKVNKTTVSVPSGVGGSWEDKVPISGISRHVPVATMKDDNLRKFHAASSGKARAALEAEMKRRGLRP